MACVISLDLAAGVAALSVRQDRAPVVSPEALMARALEGSGATAEPETGGSGGILGGAPITRREGGTVQAPAGLGAGPAGAPGGPTGSTAATAPTSSTARPTSSTATAPTTTTTRRPVTSSTAPATSSTRPTTTTGGGAGPNGSDAAGTPVQAPAEPVVAGFTDPAGDTTVDGTGKAKRERRADITRSDVTYASNGIVFALQTDERGDPAQDPRWASDSTFVSWEMDTNGDAAPDFEIQYFLVEGSLAAAVSRAGDTEGAPVCDAEAVYTSDRYVAAFDPACVGNPASFSYRVKMFYDTDPKDDEADVVTDVGPDGGLSRPLARPAG